MRRLETYDAASAGAIGGNGGGIGDPVEADEVGDAEEVEDVVEDVVGESVERHECAGGEGINYKDEGGELDRPGRWSAARIRGRASRQSSIQSF